MRAILDRLPPTPRFCVWELTLRCNMNCLHCGSNAGKPRPGELSTDEALKLCDELAELGCEKVTLLGGEPFIHKDWEKIARRLKANGVRCNAISNGWAFTNPGLVDRIKAAGLTNLALSVDGTQDVHDHLRDRPGSFARVIGAFRMMRKAKMPAAAVTVITRQVFAVIEDLYEQLVDEGVLLWQIQIGVPTGRMGNNRDWLMEPRDMVKVVAFAERVRKEGRIRLDIADNIGYFGPSEQALRAPPGADTIPFWTGCFAGAQNIGIDANGDIKGCLALPSIPKFIEGNIRKKSLREIWEGEDAFAYVRKFKVSDLGGFCRTCEYAELCRGGCTAARFGFTKELQEYPYCLHRVLVEQRKKDGAVPLAQLREYLAENGYPKALAAPKKNQKKKKGARKAPASMRAPRT